ncbi:metallophosphoesterase family protein [[Eubacterium] cellulosolvens]
MKIFHLADTHLGFSAYNKLDHETGLNQREMDFYTVFQEFVDKALVAKPDLILHSGDFFDSVRPTNRAISIAMDQLLRLSKAGVPIVIIAGNHSTPRLRETGSVFRLFEHLEHVYPIYKSKYEIISFPKLELKVHAVPHCTDSELLQQALEQLAPDPETKYNIAMLHAAVIGITAFRSSEFNEQDVPSGYLHKDFDYIALGHYHEFCRVEENAYYSGSTERLNFLEAQHKNKGFVEVNLGEFDTHMSPDEVEHFYPEPTFHELTTRPMIDLKPLDCSMLEHYAIANEITSRVQSIEPNNKILRLKVQNLPVEVYQSLDFNQLRKLTAEALNFEIQYEVTKADQGVQAPSIKFKMLGTEFKEFLANEAIEGLDKARLYELGLEYLTDDVEGKTKNIG